jgi:hypothetical protein
MAPNSAVPRGRRPCIGFDYQSDWTFTDPAEWDPFDPGRIDLCRHVYADVKEVSLTPNPQLPTRILSVR